MSTELDLSFYPYLNGAAYWRGFPANEQTPEIWLWAPALQIGVDCDLDTISHLTAAGWERLEGTRWGQDLDTPRYLHMYGQLADIRLMPIPGRADHEIWARTADIKRIAEAPAALAFARPPGIEQAPEQALTHSPDGRLTLQVAQAIPPPQFGEYGLVLGARGDQMGWRVYPLSALGDEGLEIWKRLGDTLTALAAPGEWWPHTKPLEACLRGEHAQLREDLRSKLLATSGQEREKWRERLALLEIDHRHAQALRKARERARQDTTTWLERWQMVEDLTQELAALYWATHQAALGIRSKPDESATPTIDAAPTEATTDAATLHAIPPQPEDPEAVGILTRIVDSDAAASLDTPSYQVDRAAREAMLSDKKSWTVEEGMQRFTASNNLAVYFGNPDHPLDLAEAQEQLLRIRESTVLTIRIAEGIWNQRRRDDRYVRNGMVGITYNEILQWRGIQKHKRAAYPGAAHQVTVGWRTDDREDVRLDFEVASRLHLRGRHVVKAKGKERIVHVDDVYIRTTKVSQPALWGEEHLGVFFAPGDWIADYEQAGNVYLAEIDRRVFQLNPQNERHELLLALYFTEQWRYQASEGDYTKPIGMEDLLRKSVIKIDHKHLVYRFIPRIEAALQTLQDRGIIGRYECLTPPDRSKGRWGNDWLKSRWRILPPAALAQSYIDKGITRGAPQLPPTRRGRPPKTPK